MQCCNHSSNFPLWLSQPSFNVFLNVWHKKLFHQINLKWGVLLYMVCWTSRTVSGLALHLPRYDTQRHRKGSLMCHVFYCLTLKSYLLRWNMKLCTVIIQVITSSILKIVRIDVALIKLCAVFFHFVMCVSPALYFVPAEKFYFFFRFVWPCIINVGEERTNRWHKYRCLFTVG